MLIAAIIQVILATLSLAFGIILSNYGVFEGTGTADIIGTIFACTSFILLSHAITNICRHYSKSE